MDFRLSVGLTIGNPEVVGALTNCLFQIWHGIFLANDPSGPGQKTCSRRVNEILTGQRKPSVARVRPKTGIKLMLTERRPGRARAASSGSAGPD
ncbi:hypothetical protein AC629_12770 [Bradyrhizobium sp. NAS80.1]|nr:hypothetical protein AC629_12770 [Bradyrhizobium sp. NAS80.1]